MSASREREISSPSTKALVQAIVAAEAVKELEARSLPPDFSLPDFAKKLGWSEDSIKFYEKVFGKLEKSGNLRRMTGTPPQQHTEKLKRGYVSPSRRGLVPVTAHVPPELRQALHEKYEQSGCDSFNEFMTSLLQRTIDAPANHDTSVNVAEAVEQTRALQKTISKLAIDLSSRRSR